MTHSNFDCDELDQALFQDSAILDIKTEPDNSIVTIPIDEKIGILMNNFSNIIPYDKQNQHDLNTYYFSLVYDLFKPYVNKEKSMMEKESNIALISRREKVVSDLLNNNLEKNGFIRSEYHSDIIKFLINLTNENYNKNSSLDKFNGLTYSILTWLDHEKHPGTLIYYYLQKDMLLSIDNRIKFIFTNSEIKKITRTNTQCKSSRITMFNISKNIYESYFTDFTDKKICEWHCLKDPIDFIFTSPKLVNNYKCLQIMDIVIFMSLEEQLT